MQALRPPLDRVVAPLPAQSIGGIGSGIDAPDVQPQLRQPPRRIRARTGVVAGKEQASGVSASCFPVVAGEAEKRAEEVLDGLALLMLALCSPLSILYSFCRKSTNSEYSVLSHATFSGRLCQSFG